MERPVLWGIGLTSRKLAKAGQTQGLTPTEFAAPEFGIKAKLPLFHSPLVLQFAAPEFGIKAKLLSHSVSTTN